MRCATDTWQQVPASVRYQPVRTRGAVVRPFLQLVHIASATTINGSFERPVARGACTKVCLIFPPLYPEGISWNPQQGKSFPSSISLFRSILCIPAYFEINLIFPAFTVMIYKNASICFDRSAQLSRTLDMFNKLKFWDPC